MVNSTTISGYAGKIEKTLIDYKNTDASNAKGDYPEGNYLLLDEANPALVELVAQSTGLTIEYDETLSKKIEDPNENYDAVVVLAAEN